MSSSLDQTRQDVLALLEETKFESAAELARDGVDAYPDDPTLTMLYGLALVQMGEIDEGTRYLKLATELDPHDPQAFHNVALALYNQGEFQEAEVFVQEALRLDPEHEASLSTLALCREAKGAASFEVEEQVLSPSSDSVRLGSDDGPVHVLHLGEAWTKVGFGLVAFCIFSFMYVTFCPFLGVGGVLRHDLNAKFSLFLYISSALACDFWILVDVIDRREKFVWLLPIWVCGFVALPVLPLAFYLALRRKMIRVG
jgi:tetratricopeptide (TPR) repeat protein